MVGGRWALLDDVAGCRLGSALVSLARACPSFRRTAEPVALDPRRFAVPAKRRRIFPIPGLAKLTVPPENLARWKLTSPPENTVPLTDDPAREPRMGEVTAVKDNTREVEVRALPGTPRFPGGPWPQVSSPGRESGGGWKR